MRRAAQSFLAGVLTILPVEIRVATIVWVTDFVHRFVGRGTPRGDSLQRFGLRFVLDDALAYVLGAALVLAAILGLGLVAQAGA